MYHAPSSLAPNLHRRRHQRARIACLAVLGATLLAVAGCTPEPERDGIQLSGTVEARESDLAFQVPGRIVRLLADEGATVEAGAVIGAGVVVGQGTVVGPNASAKYSGSIKNFQALSNPWSWSSISNCQGT